MTRPRRQILVGSLMFACTVGCGSPHGQPMTIDGGAGSGGSSGAGGSGGSAVGGAGGSSDPNVCGARGEFGLHLMMSEDDRQDDPSTWGPYDGPATVEQSTSSALVLVRPSRPGTTDGGAGDPDGGLKTIRHPTVWGLDPMPLFPVGATVWLSENRANPNTQGALLYQAVPWSISVRDRQGGTLLFGAALDQFDTVASPVRLGPRSDDCTGPNPMQSSPCAPGPNITYQAVEVEGDAPAVIHDSQPGKISLGGVEYNVRLTARRLSDRPTGSDGFNCRNQEGIALDIQAVDLTTLVGTLDAGAPP